MYHFFYSGFTWILWVVPNFLMSTETLDEFPLHTWHSLRVAIESHCLFPQETYGEDPFLTGEMTRAFVTGLQGPDPRYVRANAGCKHYAAYAGPENYPVSRFSFNAQVNTRDGQISKGILNPIVGSLWDRVFRSLWRILTFVALWLVWWLVFHTANTPDQ